MAVDPNDIDQPLSKKSGSACKGRFCLWASAGIAKQKSTKEKIQFFIFRNFFKDEKLESV